MRALIFICITTTTIPQRGCSAPGPYDFRCIRLFLYESPYPTRCTAKHKYTDITGIMWDIRGSSYRYYDLTPSLKSINPISILFAPFDAAHGTIQNTIISSTEV